MPCCRPRYAELPIGADHVVAEYGLDPQVFPTGFEGRTLPPVLTSPVAV